MQWKSFKDELPEEDRLILYGNHRLVECDFYKSIFNHSEQKMAFKPITHWCYVNLPPVVEGESKWKTT